MREDKLECMSEKALVQMSELLSKMNKEMYTVTVVHILAPQISHIGSDYMSENKSEIYVRKCVGHKSELVSIFRY